MASDRRDKIFAIFRLVDRGAGRDMRADYEYSVCTVYYLAADAMRHDWLDFVKTQHDVPLDLNEMRVEETEFPTQAFPADSKDNKGGTKETSGQSLDVPDFVASLLRLTKLFNSMMEPRKKRAIGGETSQGISEACVKDARKHSTLPYSTRLLSFTCDGSACGSFAAMQSLSQWRIRHEFEDIYREMKYNSKTNDNLGMHYAFENSPGEYARSRSSEVTSYGFVGLHSIHSRGILY